MCSWGELTIGLSSHFDSKIVLFMEESFEAILLFFLIVMKKINFGLLTFEIESNITFFIFYI